MSAIYFAAYFIDQLNRKFARHSQFEYIDTLDTLILLFGVLVAIRAKMLAVFVFAPLVLAAFVVGEERITMVSFLVFLGFFVVERRTLHPAFLLLLSYFSLKSISFFENVYEFNSAF